MLAVTLIITFLPFQFAVPERWHVMLYGGIEDAVANVILFVPLGFFYCFARMGRVSASSALLFGALLSAGIECVQLFESDRHASVSDVITNAAGAWIGAYAALHVLRSPKIDGRLIGWLALELPLMGLMYLLVPLLWVNALAAGHELFRAAMALALGLFGALLLGGVQRYYFAFGRTVRPTTTAAFAALWFAAGASPFVRTHPLEVVVGPLLVAFITWAYGFRRSTSLPQNRRFEVPLLIRAMPIYAIYLIAAVWAPLRHGIDSWHWMLALPTIAADQLEILRLLELVAAFTLVGYIAAEFKGRAYQSYRDARLWVFTWGVVLAVLTEIVRGYDASSGASVAHGVLLVGAALYGGWLYYLQRAHVMRVLSAQ